MSDDVYPGEPPFDPFEDTPPPDGPGRTATATQDRPRARQHTATHAVTAESATATIRLCLAAHQGKAGAELVEFIGQLRSSDVVWRLLDTSYHRTVTRICEVVSSVYADTGLLDRVDWVGDITDQEALSWAVRDEIGRIAELATVGNLPPNPTRSWRLLRDRIQRAAARGDAQRLVGAVDADATDEELMDLFRALTPPSSRTEVRNNDFIHTARELEARDRSAASSSAAWRVSSGFPSLDVAFTARDARGGFAEPVGFAAPGEFHVFAGATGNGKSALVRGSLIPACAADLVHGWGFTEAKVLVCHTEESSSIVYRAAKLQSGSSMAHLADSVVVANTGASRTRIVHAVWDMVIAAHRFSKKTGRPITEGPLPYVIFWDYIGGTVEAGEAADSTAMQINADLGLRGLAAWDVLGMEMFSGESFSAYAGMPWPTGMENFAPAVVTFAQFRKLPDPMWFDPQAKSANPADFVLDNPDGSTGWVLREGDFRIPTQSEIRGSGVLANHATSIVILHRSRPGGRNPIMHVDGQTRLADDRARLVLAKTRNGAAAPFVPMRFDSQPSGLRGQFFDVLAETAIDRGVLDPGPAYTTVGDPILPDRPTRTVFDGVYY